MSDKQAKRRIRLADVPEIPGRARSEVQPNGDTIWTARDHRWRTHPDGTIRYYIQCQAGAGLEKVPYERVYRGPR